METIEFVNHVDNLKPIRDFVNKVLKDFAIPDSEIYKIILATDEICANLCCHNLDTNPIKIKVNYHAGLVEVAIIDFFKPFSPKKTFHSDLYSLIQIKRKGGIGLSILNKIIDKIDYKTEFGKNICTLYKKVKIKDGE